MKTKTAYRPKNIPAETPRVEIDDQPVQPSASTTIDFDTSKADPAEVKVAAVEPAAPENEAAQALLHQLSHLRQSEQMQALRAQQMTQMAAPAPTLPPGRADRLSLWKAHGNLSDEDAAFLQERPDMIDNPEITRVAYAATLQAGIDRNSPDFAAAMEGNFASLLSRAEAQAQPATDPAGFFKPAPLPAHAQATPSALYSAPVSRGPVGGPREPTNPRQIKLTVLEQEIARNLGLSDVAYAEGKLALLKRKASGELQ